MSKISGNPPTNNRVDTDASGLVDRFGRVHDYLRLSVTDRCNLRCVYCMPPQGIELKERSEILTYDEIMRLTRVLAEMGIRKVRLTGGEPLVRSNLCELVKSIVELPGIDSVGMTTNGVLLQKYVGALRAAGLHGLNISIDSLRRDRYRDITGRDNLPDVLKGVDLALEAGFRSIKINAVIMAGVNEDEIPEFVELARTKPVNVRFIEFMPFTWNGWKREKMIPFAEMKAAAESYYPLHPMEASTSRNKVAKDYSIDGFEGKISFISSMTENFCDSCSRLRLMADGSFRSCLFYPAEMNLREPLRSGTGEDKLKEIITELVQRKPTGHPPLHEIEMHPNQTMIEIGG